MIYVSWTLIYIHQQLDDVSLSGSGFAMCLEGAVRASEGCSALVYTPRSADDGCRIGRLLCHVPGEMI
jgi:hypothetical protein